MTRRRIVRAVILTGLLLVLVALLARAALGRWAEGRWVEASARFEREVGSLDLASWELPPVLVERNAATWIAKGAAAVVLETGRPGHDDVTTIAAKPRALWSADEVARVRAAVALNRDALEILGRARSAEGSTFDVHIRDGVEAKLPNLLEILKAAKLVHARAVLALGEGRRAEALADLDLLRAIAESVEREPLLVMVLIGTTIERLELRLVHAYAEDPATDSAELERIETGILGNDLLAVYGRSFAADGAAVCTALREGEDAAHIEAPYSAVDLLRPAIDPALAAACLDSHRELGAVLARPRAEADAAVAAARQRLDSSWLTREVAEITIPNLLNGSSRMSATLALRRLARLALTARALALETGRYPETIDALPAATAPDPLTGGTVSWRIAPDGSAVLELPGAESIAAEMLPAGSPRLPWSWKLPPP